MSINIRYTGTASNIWCWQTSTHKCSLDKATFITLHQELGWADLRVNCSHDNMISRTSSNIRSPRTQYLTQRVGSLGIHQFSSVQDGIYAFGKVHMRCTPSLRGFPNVAFETVPMFAWLTMALEYIRQPPLSVLSNGKFGIHQTVSILRSNGRFGIHQTVSILRSNGRFGIHQTVSILRSHGRFGIHLWNLEYIKQPVFSCQREDREYIRQPVFPCKTEVTE